VAPQETDRQSPAGRGTPGRRSWRRTLAYIGGGLLALLLLGLFLVTSPRPWAAERRVPTAEQVAAGRDAVLQLRSGLRDSKQLSHVALGSAQLDGFAALASHGFRPDRLDIWLRDTTLNAVASHRLWFGRWINVEATTAGRSTGFPQVRMNVGHLHFGPTSSRYIFSVARWALTLRGVRLPALDDLVREVAVGPDIVTATLFLPGKTRLVDELAGTETAAIDEDTVVRLYCRLANMQRAQPEGDFAAQVRRAFTARAGEPAEVYNKAAFVALAMFVVSDRVGGLAGKAQERTGSCRIGPVLVSIHGRSDLPKHWSLSAAFSVTAGSQFAQAIGEWKELADSLSRESMFARGDPSGFSFVDLSADRAGFRTANAAAAPATAEQFGARLAAATPEQLLPLILLQRPEGLANADFVARFGGIGDPRYLAAVRRIDSALEQDGIR
jgi:hypothetical protein